MAGPGRIPGRYNLIVEAAYQTFDHQIPVETFIEQLENDTVPDEVTVTGLEDALEDGGLADELSKKMDARANDLEYQNPTVQFRVDGSFHRSGKSYDLRYGDELYPLRDVFGSQIERKEDGKWLVTTF